MTKSAPTTRHRGVTLIELVVVILIVAVLAGLLTTVLSGALFTARKGGEEQFLRSIRIGIDQFQNEFNMLPPLVADCDPVDLGGTEQPNTRSLAYLSNQAIGDPCDDGRRYSVLSLSYYLMGALDEQTNDGTPIDGVNGPRFSAVRPDGSFSRRGRSYDPLFEPESDRLIRSDLNPNQWVVLLDRWGKGTSAPNFDPTNALDTPISAVRYYRWEPEFETTGSRQGQVRDFNIPGFLDDSEKNPEIRAARYAIVSAGPDGMINENDPNAMENRDNIVEVGK